jgi:hypothetical protein
VAARRLLIIMVILLTISTLAAALVPPPEERSDESSTSSTTTTTDEGGAEEPPAKADDLVRAQIAVPRKGEAGEQIAVAPGDQRALTVSSREPGEVSLPDFGLIEFAGPGNDATFNVLIEEDGDFPIRFQDSGEVGTIVSKASRDRNE